MQTTDEIASLKLEKNAIIDSRPKVWGWKDKPINKKINNIPDYCNKKILLLTKDRLQTALQTLENQKKSTLLNTNYQDTLKTYGKTYHLSRDLITKITYIASWSDRDFKLTKAIERLLLSRNIDFIDGIKSIDSNVYAADIIWGPVKAEIIDKNKHYTNTWYNVLKKSVMLAIKANNHFLKNIERVEKEIQDKKIADAEAIKKHEEQIRKKEETLKLNEENKKLEEKNKKIEEALEALANTTDDWEDLC